MKDHIASNGGENHDAGIAYFTSKLFDNSLKRAAIGGGEQQKKAMRVKAVLGSLREKDPFHGLPRTNHGESRIHKCVKYDLGNGWRLITQQTDKLCIFLFVGSHDDADQWLERHKGMQPAVDHMRVVLIPGSGERIADLGDQFVDHHDKPLAERLSAESMDHVLSHVPRSLSKRLELLNGRTTTDQISSLTSQIPDPAKAEFVRTVFTLLRAGNEDGAQAHINLSMGRIDRLEDIDEADIVNVMDGEDIRRLRLGSPEYETWLRAFQRDSEWYEWFLYLHPEQERVVQADYPGVSQLSGVSGSGKTCVAVRRALRLAEARDSRVLVLTLNRSLAKLLERLVNAACSDEAQRERIEVASFFEFAQKRLSNFEPENTRYYTDVTWKLNEHVDEIFREYYRQWANNESAEVLLPLHKSLMARGIAAEAYLREEFDWIRSAVGGDRNERYVEIVRQGRRFPILPDQRANVLGGLEGWERKMRAVGVIDYLGLTSALTKHLSKFESEYTNVLVDEAQDFGTTELQIVRQLVPHGPNDIFLCGDIAQTILPKHRSLAEAGLSNVARARIQKNYRNSREILQAAYEVLKNNLHEEMFENDDLEILDPKFANFSGPVPMALDADTLEDEIAYARAFAETSLRNDVKSVCIAFAGYSTRDVTVFASKCGVTALDGAYNPNLDRLVFSDLEQSKGYEFDTLIIVNCCDGVLPPRDAPEEEAFRASCKLYVAMTRAKNELILSFHGKASQWIVDVAGSIGVGRWTDFETISDAFRQGLPTLLPELEHDSEANDVGRLNGLQFVYTSRALGLSVEAQDKLIELVDGRGLKGSGGRRLRWKDIGSLKADLDQSRRHDLLFGPKVIEEVRAALATNRDVRTVLRLPS